MNSEGSRSLVALAALASVFALAGFMALVPGGSPIVVPASSTDGVPAEALEAAPVDAGTAESYLEALGDDDASYEAKRLVVYFGRPQSASVVSERVTPDVTYVKSDGGGLSVRSWSDDDKRTVSDGVASMSDTSVRGPLDPSDIVAKYDVSVGKSKVIKGEEVVPLELVRRSDGRRVERLWVHPRGVVYERELFGDDGTVIGLSTLLDMKWGANPAPAERLEAVSSSSVRRSKPAHAPKVLPFGYELQDGYVFTASGRRAEHWVYGDGLHTLSIFRTKGRLSKPDGYEPVDVERATLWIGPGPATWTWEGGGYSWTLVGEEPQLDPARLTEPFPRGGPSMAARMGAWWARGFGWVADRF